MPNHRRVRALGSLALAVLLLAPSAKGELEAWNQAKVSGFASNLAEATDALYETFSQQPPPKPGSMQSESYHRLEHRVWMLRVEARVLLKSLEEGDGREQTLWTYDNLLSHARSARYEADGVFVATDVAERASTVRGVLNQLGPYYDPDFRTLAPDPKIEPGATR
jgi:hypothetical protein